MSPEQCLGKKLDARSDVYSLGCVLYEMVIGEPPFQAASVLETMMAHIHSEGIQFPANAIPTALAAVLDQAIQRDIEQRYQSVEQFQDALDQAAHAIATGGATKFQRRNRRKAHLYDRIAECQYKLGAYAQAEKDFEQAVIFRRLSPGPKGNFLAGTLMRQSNNFDAQSKYAEAIKSGQEAVQLFKEMGGQEIFMITQYCHLCEIALEQNDSEHARQYMNQAIAYENKCGYEDNGTIKPSLHGSPSTIIDEDTLHWIDKLKRSVDAATAKPN